MALIRYIVQRSTGRAPDEDRLTLTGISKEYKTSVRTLQGYLPEIQGMLAEVRECSAAVGITQLDVIADVRRYHREVVDLLDEAKEKGDLDTRKQVLQTLMPLSLDRLQMLVPKVESEGLTGMLGAGGGGEGKGGNVLNLGLVLGEALQGKQAVEAGAPKTIEAQREVKQVED